MRDSCQSFGVRRRSFPLARLDVGLLGLALTTFRAFHAILCLNLGIRFVSCLPHFLPRVLNDRHLQIVLCRTIKSSPPLCVESNGRKQAHSDVIAKSVPKPYTGSLYRKPVLYGEVNLRCCEVKVHTCDVCRQDEEEQ